MTCVVNITGYTPRFLRGGPIGAFDILAATPRLYTAAAAATAADIVEFVRTDQPTLRGSLAANAWRSTAIVPVGQSRRRSIAASPGNVEVAVDRSEMVANWSACQGKSVQETGIDFAGFFIIKL